MIAQHKHLWLAMEETDAGLFTSFCRDPHKIGTNVPSYWGAREYYVKDPNDGVHS